jgi:dTDP-4-amino-4,6-dideoxygalactose transaminase
MTIQRIFLSPPFIGDEEKSAVMAALDGGWVAPTGPDLEAFEKEVAERAGRSFGVGVSSGTAALHLSLLALGVRPGDIVVCPTMTFVATANAIRYVGAEPVFIDSDLATGNMSPDLLEQALREIFSSGSTVAGVIAVDFLGKCADYESISQLCQRYGLFLLADSAESIGATYQGQPAGSFGDVAVFSFNGNKIITTSSGGMVVTDDGGIAEKVRFLSTQAREPAIHYEHLEVGYNYRLSNILSALGRAQLEKLDYFVAQRKDVRHRYQALFADIDGVEIFGAPDTEDNFWLTSVIVNPDSAGWTAESLQQHLEEDGIESRPLWKPMHLQPLYQSCQAFIDGSSEELFTQGLALPSGVGLSDSQWTRIHDSIARFLEQRS